MTSQTDVASAPPAEPEPVADTAARLRLAGRGLARLGGLLLAVFAIMAIFSVLSDGRFLIVDNLLGMLRYMSTVAIIGLGLCVVLVIGEIDLSFANLYGLSGIITAVAWIVWGWPVYLAILLAFAVAVLVGCFNAFFISIVKIPSFIATLGSSTLLFGITLLVSDSQSFNPAYPPAGREVAPGQLAFFRGMSNQELPFGLPMQALWMAAVALVFGFLLSRSLFGFRLKAIGGNQRAAELARLPVTKYKFIAFIVMALAASLAAVLDFAFIGSIQPTAGQQLLFPTFAAVIIGGASLSGGRGTVVGTLSGALLLAVIANGLALLAAGSFAQQMFLGTVTIAAVVLDQATRRLR